MTNASNYHVATQGKFKKVDFNVFKLMQEYFIYRRLKNKPEFIEVEGRFFQVQFQSQSKNSFFQSRSNSFYFIEKGKKIYVIRTEIFNNNQNAVKDVEKILQTIKFQ